MLLRLASSLVTVVRQCGWQADSEMKWQFLKFYIRPPVSVLLYLMLYYILYGLVLFRKGGFCQVRCL